MPVYKLRLKSEKIKQQIDIKYYVWVKLFFMYLSNYFQNNSLSFIIDSLYVISYIVVKMIFFLIKSPVI